MVVSNGHCLTTNGHHNNTVARPLHHRFIQKPPLMAKKTIRRLLAFSVVVMVFNLWRIDRMMTMMNDNETYYGTTSSLYLLYGAGSLSYLLGAGPEVPILTTNNHHNNNNNKTLVIYSGPLTFANDQDDQSVLKWANFMYFLEKGIGCGHYHDDVVVVVGFQLQAYTEEKLAPLKQKCQQYPPPPHGGGPKQITVLPRANRCYHMESVRLAMQHTHNRPYQYFVVLTDSVTGPYLPPPPTPSSHRHYLSPELLPPWETSKASTQDDNDNTTIATTVSSLSWTSFLTSRLTDEIKMVGLSVSCRGGEDRLVDPHVESSLYALDGVGMRIVLKTNCVYDCRRDEAGDGPQAVYTRYDLGMSRTILRAGYGITSILQPHMHMHHHNHNNHNNNTLASTASAASAVSAYFSNNTKECRHSNVWHRHEMYRYFQRIPSFEELRFFQTTRFVPDEIADAIGYTGRPRVFPEEQSYWDDEILQMALGGRTNLLAPPSTPKTEATPPQERSSVPYRVVVFLVQPICTSLEWMDSYFRGIPVESYTIINNCGNRADGAPVGARIIPATNFSTEQVFATLLLQVAQDYANARNNTTENDDVDDDGDDVLVFWHGGANLKNGWNGTEIVHRARVTGFACKTKPFCAPRCRNKFQPTAMHQIEYWNAFTHTTEDEETSSRTTTRALSKTDDDFEDDESMAATIQQLPQRLGDWVRELGGVNEHRLVPVCHGNGFAVRRRQVALQSLGFWKALQQRLVTAPSRSRRKADFVFAERSWAALLTEPLPVEVVRAMHNRTATILGKKAGYAVRHQRREMKGMLLFDQPSS